MPRRRKVKVKRPDADAAAADRRRRRLRLTAHGLGVVVSVGAVFIGYRAVSTHAQATHSLPDHPPPLVLVDRPKWMDDAIATGVASRALAGVPSRPSLLDHDAVIAVHDNLARDPWVRGVGRVVRTRHAFEVYCDWRTPGAMVRVNNGSAAGQYRLVARDGVVLPLEVDPADVARVIAPGAAGGLPTHLRVVTGVRRSPPGPGAAWEDPGLRAGLDVAYLLHGHPAAGEVVVIDVSNHDGLVSPTAARVVLKTRAGTDIYWGRPPAGSDFLVETTPEVKLRHLQTAADYFGRQGKWPAWVDLRNDEVRMPR